jgi:uncharacterized membrane protein
MMRAMRRYTASLVALGLLGCSGATTSPDASVRADVSVAADVPVTAVTADVAASADVPAGCVPDRAAWDTEVRALVARQCGTCHGAQPTFGAPFSLLDYDALLRREGPARRVDLMAAALAAGTMPPSNTPAPAADVAERITSWASCGARTASTAPRLRVTRGWMRAPATAP